MALGNANTSAQARGKAKPVIVKRRKEVMLAKGYNSSCKISTATFASDTLACTSSDSCNLTIYHDGSAAVPSRFDKVYIRPRANDKYRLPDGLYKASLSGVSRYYLSVKGGQNRFAPCS